MLSMGDRYHMTRNENCVGPALHPLSSTDGFVRLSLDAILCLRLEHMLSGLEHDQQKSARCGTPTTICGFSEWVSSPTPRLSLGWDWRLSFEQGMVGLVRVGLPRSNVMLIDSQGSDYDWQRNLEMLGTVVDALPWRADTRRTLALCTL